jgi:hypothetical protein
MPLYFSLFPEARSLFNFYPASAIQSNQQLDGSISGRGDRLAAELSWLSSTDDPSPIQAHDG